MDPREYFARIEDALAEDYALKQIQENPQTWFDGKSLKKFPQPIREALER